MEGYPFIFCGFEGSCPPSHLWWCSKLCIIHDDSTSSCFAADFNIEPFSFSFTRPLAHHTRLYIFLARSDFPSRTARRARAAACCRWRRNSSRTLRSIEAWTTPALPKSWSSGLDSSWSDRTLENYSQKLDRPGRERVAGARARPRRRGSSAVRRPVVHGVSCGIQD